MRPLLLACACAVLIGLSGCGSEEKPAAQAPLVKPQDSGAGPPPEVKKGGRIPGAPPK